VYNNGLVSQLTGRFRDKIDIQTRCYFHEPHFCLIMSIRHAPGTNIVIRSPPKETLV